MPFSQNIHANVSTDFTPQAVSPQIDASAFIHARAVVIGDVRISEEVFVGPFASVRGDEGVPIFIGAESNVQDGVILHALKTFEKGRKIEQNLRTVEGNGYAIYIGRRVSLAHQCQIHGPAVVLDGTFIGMQSLIFRATVGKNCVVEPAARVINVEIADNRYIPAGAVINNQAQADELPAITKDYPLGSLNDSVIHVNTQLAAGYLKESAKC